MSELLSPVAAGFVTGLVLVAALAINRFAPTERKHIRRLVALWSLYLLLTGLSWLLDGDSGWARAAQGGAEVLGFFTIVATLGTIIFDLALPAARIRVPTIAAELIMGAGYTVATMIVLRRFGFDLASLLATSAVLTAILALSLQATLGNVIGGVALQLDNSIRVGDWVMLENGKQGKVREIRWRHTVIETRDWDALIVPNAQLLASTFTILGQRMGQPVQHRMWVYFNVDFRFNPTDVIRAVEDSLRAAPLEGVAKNPPPQVVCQEFSRVGGESMAHYAARYWLTDLAADDPTSSRVRMRIYAALKRAGIPLAVPASHIWVEQDSNERRARKMEQELETRRLALRTVSFLAPLSDHEIDALAPRLRYAPFAAGETITREGAVAHWLYIITEGEAELRLAAARNKRVATIIGPDVIGEMGLITGEPRAASVVAITDVECYRLDKEAFQEILARRPELADEISSLVAARLGKISAVKTGRHSTLDATPDDGIKLLTSVRRFFGLEGSD